MRLEDFGVDSTYRGIPGHRSTVGNHTRIQYDADGAPKILVYPLQLLPGGKGTSWQSVPQEFRAAGYGEPRKEGSIHIGPDGQKMVWKREVGFVTTGEILTPRASYTKPDGTSDGTVVSAGYLPNGRWVDLDGTIWAAGSGPSAGSPTIAEAMNTFIDVVLTEYGTK